MNNISVELLRRLFTVDTKGRLIRKVSVGSRARKGDVAGWPAKSGHLSVLIEGRVYKTHRMIWAMHYGRWPTRQVDHINGDPTDNRIGNLREVTFRQNQQNMECHRRGKLVGTTFEKSRNLWLARAREPNGKVINLGRRKTEAEAHDLYLKFLTERGMSLPAKARVRA